MSGFLKNSTDATALQMAEDKPEWQAPVRPCWDKVSVCAFKGNLNKVKEDFKVRQ